MENERCLIKKIVKLFIFAVFIMIGLTFIMGFYYEHNIYLKLSDVTVEIGDKLPNEIMQVINLLTDKSDLSIESNIPLDDEGHTTTIGEYGYYLVYNNTDFKFSKLTNVKSKIVVIDTVKPVITVKNKKEFAYASKLNALDIFDCEDLSGCKMILDKEIDTTKSGQYEIGVTGYDGAYNKTYATTSITILEKPKPVYNEYYHASFKNMNENNNNKNALLSESEKNNLRLELVNFAKQFIGNPYVYGGTSLTNGTDCSGFTMSVYANYGYSLPRSAADQAYVGMSVNAADLQPGDLVVYFYDGHVGIYVGNGMMVHASTPKNGIMYGPVYAGYKLYRRIIY